MLVRIELHQLGVGFQEGFDDRVRDSAATTLTFGGDGGWIYWCERDHVVVALLVDDQQLWLII